MIKRKLEKFGVYMSKQQIKIFALALAAAVSWLLGSIIVTILMSYGGLCNYAFNRVGMFQEVYINNCTPETMSSANPTDWLIGAVVIAIVALSLTLSLNLVIYGLVYFIRILFNKQFREAQMSESVNYAERDEREELAVMRATRRSYMVLNFTLLAGWLFALMTNQLNIALLLFGIQLIGALSFRNQSKTVHAE